MSLCMGTEEAVLLFSNGVASLVDSSSSSIIPVPCDHLATSSHINQSGMNMKTRENTESSLGVKMGFSMSIHPAVGTRILFALEPQSFLFPE